MPKRELGIAVIGDEDLVSGMRLAGVSHYCIVSDEREAKEVVKKVVSSLLEESSVGVIAIQEDYAPFIEDITKMLQGEKRVFPVIIEVPSKHGAKYADVIAHYRAYIRRFVGFDIQI